MANTKIDPKSAHAEALALEAWAEKQYELQVTKKPVNNKYRHTLDATWTQVVRHAKERVAATTRHRGPPSEEPSK